MKSIGFRCWADRISFVILEGTQEAPTIICKDHRKAPKGASRAEQLIWLRKEVHEIFDSNKVDVAFYKATENNSRKKDLDRGQFEGVLIEAAYSHKVKCEIEGRIKSQINRDTNARKAKYVGELLQTEELEELASANFEEACLASLCGLPKK